MSGTKQNAKSLRKYLFQEVEYRSKRYTITFMGQNTIWISSESVTLFVDSFSEIYPVLKTYEDLIKSMVWEEKEVLPIEVIYGFSVGLPWEIRKTGEIASSDEPEYDTRWFVNKEFEFCHDDVSIEQFEKLTSMGFGAIKNDSSPTRYLDLFGKECVKG